jgi:hypothetical protein
MGLGLFSVWTTGILNGYNNDGLLAQYKYGLMSVVSGIEIVKALGSETKVPSRVGPYLTSIFVGIPVITAATFCVGTFVGKSVQHVSKKELT